MGEHKMPSISVVMPMRNASPWLPALLAALVKESTTPFELIAIDDGSSDQSGQRLQQLCGHWPQQRWRLLDGGGKGVSAARNLGVKASRAPLIALSFAMVSTFKPPLLLAEPKQKQAAS